jgi:choice-of-anchor C domain-containing protein
MSNTRNSLHFAFTSGAMALLAGVATAYATPFQNGSFETGPSAPVNFCCGGAPYIGTFFAPYTGIPGWTVTAGSIDILTLPGWAPSDGLRSIDLDGLSAATLVQTFDTIPGMTYNVSFDLAANFYAGQAIKHVLVTAPGFSQTYAFNSAGRTALNMGWETHAFQFVAAGVSSSLSFADTDPTSAFGPALDNVRVNGNTTAVPEPATFALIGLGLAAGLGFSRRKRM